MSSTYPLGGEGFAGRTGGPFGPYGFAAFGTDPRSVRRGMRHLHRQWMAMSEGDQDGQSAAEKGDAEDRPQRQRGPRGERGEGRDTNEGREGHSGRGRGGRRGGRRGGFGGPGFGVPGFGGPGFGGPGFGGPGFGAKAARGDIRAGVLALLAEQPRHGYEIIQELAERSGGVWRASPGSIYPMLKRLADEGLVTADRETGRKVFDLTEAGRVYVTEHAEELEAPWDDVASGVDDRSVKLRDLVLGLGAAVFQVDQAGTPEQVDAAAALLAEARRGLYRILAEEPDKPE